MTPKTYSKFKSILIALLILPYLNSCGLIRDVDPKKVSHDPNERIKRNIEEGRGIRLFGNKKKDGEFNFASSNSLWRASLDTINFMPLLTADYGGGIIVTDWFNRILTITINL